MIGDFGLATFPGKPAITSDNKAVGPRNYIAPELMLNPSEASPGPADVWSFAKTLWVLCTRQRFPLEGQFRRDAPAYLISAIVQHPRAYLLEALIERCTDLEPSDRPTIGTVAKELRTWLDSAKHRSRGVNLDTLGDRLGALRHSDMVRQTQKYWASLKGSTLREDFREACAPIEAALAHNGFQAGVMEGGAGDDLGPIQRVDAGTQKFAGSIIHMIEDRGRGLQYQAVASVEVYESRWCRLGARSIINTLQPIPRVLKHDVLWRDSVELPVDAPVQIASAMTLLSDRLLAALPEGLTRFVELCEAAHPMTG